MLTLTDELVAFYNRLGYSGSIADMQMAYLQDVYDIDLADGQSLVWDTDTDRFVASNPVGNSLNAKAVNATGALTDTTGTGVVVPSSAISVTNSGGRDVILEWDGTVIQSVVGTGSVLLSVYETTSGAVHRKSIIRPLPNSIAAALATFSLGKHCLSIGPVTTTRTFELRISLVVASGTPTARLSNAGTSPTILEAINQ